MFPDFFSVSYDYDLTTKLCTSQSDFFSLYSTNHALITITEKIRKAIDNREVACSEFLNEQKAFDTVDHEVSFNDSNMSQSKILDHKLPLTIMVYHKARF